MKKLIFIFTFFISINAFSSLWIPKQFSNQEQLGSFKISNSKKLCKKDNPTKTSKCIKIIGKYNYRYFDLKDEFVKDFSSPKYSESEKQICNSKEFCESLNLTKKCLDKFEKVYMAKDFSKIYCSKMIGYNTMKSGNKILVQNDEKKLQYENELKLAKEEKKKTKNGVKLLKSKKFTNMTDQEKDRVIKYILRNL